MLIHDALELRENFSGNEKIVAQYLLAHKTQIKTLSISQIAKQTYTSPSTTVRLANKLGYEGWKQLKQAYVEELEYTKVSFDQVDVNLPFGKQDDQDLVAKNLSSLEAETITDTYRFLDVDQAKVIAEKMSQAERIYIFGFTLSIGCVYDFVEKMLTIGKRVEILRDVDDIYYTSYYATRNDCILIISYSGETKELIEAMERMKKNHVTIYALTSIGENTVAQNADGVLHLSTREKLFSKISTFSSSISIHYVMDVLFSLIYQMNYDQNWEDKLTHNANVDQERKTNISILK